PRAGGPGHPRAHPAGSVPGPRRRRHRGLPDHPHHLVHSQQDGHRQEDRRRLGGHQLSLPPCERAGRTRLSPAKMTRSSSERTSCRSTPPCVSRSAPTSTGSSPTTRTSTAPPELSMQETRTAAEIDARLTDLGLTTPPYGGTGVVAVIENGKGPVIGYRADIDGLPIAEDTGLDYASTAEGILPGGETTAVMHGCGHDTHITV